MNLFRIALRLYVRESIPEGIDGTADTSDESLKADKKAAKKEAKKLNAIYEKAEQNKKQRPTICTASVVGSMTVCVANERSVTISTQAVVGSSMSTAERNGS